MADPAYTYQDIETRVNAGAGWRHPDDNPESLYHYTSSSAFLRILESQELWFTDFRYLNDLSELRYGIQLFEAAIANQLAQEGRPEFRDILEQLLEQLDKSLIYTDLFVFCMCEEGNLLNQWRVYGRDAAPISIELKFRDFQYPDWQPYRFEVVPMVYDRQRQIEIANRVIISAMDFAEEYQHAIVQDKQDIRAFVEILVSICVDWCVSMKHPQFDVEKEWRLAVKWGLEHRTLQGRAFRATANGIVPHLRMKPVPGVYSDGKLPIRSITIGPCAEPALHRRTMTELLHQTGHLGVEVKISGLPIRV